MKKLTKTLLMALVVAATTSAMADGANTKMIRFSANDLKYGDGTTVLDNECFALCWSQDGTFSGINADGTLVNTDETQEKLVYFTKLPVTNGSVAPWTFFVNDDKNSGCYLVQVLDTRTSDSTLAAWENKKPTRINGVAAVVFKASIGDGILGQDGVIASTDFNAANYIDESASLTITMNGDVATVSAVNLSPALTYCIKYGTDLTNLKTVPVKIVTKYGTDENGKERCRADFNVNDADGMFFKLKVYDPATDVEE